LVAQGALLRPPISDAGLLASIGIDLEAVAGRLKETFGEEAYWQATQRVRLRPTQAALTGRRLTRRCTSARGSSAPPPRRRSRAARSEQRPVSWTDVVPT
jgi:hypothetical protein